MSRLAKFCVAMIIGSSLSAAGQVVISGQVNYQGNSTPFAPIQVCAVTSTGTPCTPTAAIYYDYALSHAAPNPTAADQYGNYTFYAPTLSSPSFYVVQVTPIAGTIWSYVVNGGSGASTGNSLLACVDSSGSGTAYVCSTTPSTAPTSNMTILFRAGTVSGSAPTLAVNGAAAASILTQGGNNVGASQIAAGNPLVLTYNGTAWVISGTTSIIQISGGGTGGGTAAQGLANLGGVALNPSGTQTVTQPAATNLNVVTSGGGKHQYNGSEVCTSGNGLCAAGGAVTSVTATAPVTSTLGTTPNIAMTQSSGSVNGWLSSTDWTTFNGKQAALGYTPADSGANADITSLTGLTTPLSALQGGTGEAGTLTGILYGNGSSPHTVATAAQLGTLFNSYVGGLAGCSTSGYVYTPQGVNCVAQTTANVLIAATTGGAAPGSTFNGSAVVAFDYHSFGAEASLGNPGTNGYVLSSTTSGVRSWIAPGSGSMIYPGAGVPLSTGSAWGTSFTAPTGNIVGTGQANTYTTGLQDFSALAQIKLPVGAGYASAANGEIGYDTTSLNWHGWVNGSDLYAAFLPKTGITNGDCVNFAVSGTTITLNDAGGTCITGGSMVWPSTAGIAYWTSGTSWGGAYNSSTPIPANYLPLALSSSTSVNGTPIPASSTLVTSGNNSSITSLSGLTTPLTVGQGGTGASSTSQNYIFAGLTSGSGAPGFRVLVSGDIPSNAANTTGTAAGFTGSLAGDVTGPQSATTVGKVNGAAVPASKSVVGTNSSGQIIDATSWAENLLGAALYPGYQALYLPYMDGSGTVLHDQSGNHYDMTFASGGNAPTWSADGSIIFTPTNTIAGGQWLSGPAAVLAGAGTIQMWYEQIMPYSIDGLSHSIYKQWAIGDSSGNGLGWYPAYFGAPAMIGNPTLYNYDLIPTDRLIGNSSFTVVCNGASPATAYVNGHSPTSYLYPAVTSTLPSCPTWASTGSVEIGGTSYFSGVGNSTPQWKLFGIVVYPTTVPVTPAIVLQNEAFMSKTALPQHGATTFGIESRPPYWLAYQGDSRTANAAGSPPSGGNWQLTTSREWQISRLEPDRDQYNNMGMYNQRLSTMVTNMPNEITPLCTQNISVAKTVLLDAGTNDIQGGATGATTYASLQSYASNLHTACNGVKILYATSVARGSFTATMEGYRETLNSDAISGWVAGTFNGDAVDDNANDPIAATQVTPNTYNPSAASSCNATWFDSDCVHFTAAMNAEMASGESAAIKLVQGRLNTCTIVQKQIPYQVLVAANTASPGLTQTIPLGIQLAKGENVCSLSENITSAFTGPTTLTMSVGNSGGSTTSYQSAFSLMSGGDTTASPTYVGPGGAVNVTFTATGANLSTVSGGNMVVNVGVIYNGLY